MRLLLAFALSILAATSASAGQQVGEESSYSRKMGFETKIYYGSSGGADGQPEYICKAFPGVNGSDSTASSVWQVARLTYDADGNVTDIEYAGDDDAFSSVCDNRASLNYD